MSAKDVTPFKRFVPSERVVFSPEVTDETGVQTWIVRGGLNFYKGPRHHEYWVRVPPNFKTIGADLPDALKRMIQPNSPCGHAAILHNYLCTVGKVRIAKKICVIERADADDIFLEAMRLAGVNLFKRRLLYWCARWTRNQKVENGNSDTPEPEIVEDTLY